MQLASFLLLLLTWPVSMGIKGGAPFEKMGAGLWTFGPTIELKLPARFAIGFDALYSRAETANARGIGSATFSSRVTASQWELPVFVKFRLTNSAVRPFVLAGGTSSNVRGKVEGGCSGDAMLCGSPSTNVFTSSRFSRSGGGFAAGGGAEISWRALKIAPEIRYVRWSTGYFSGHPNRVEALLGLRF